MADTGSDAKPRIAVFSGPTATIQNSEPLVTSNKAREKYGVPVRANKDGSPMRFDVLRSQRLAAPVTVYVDAAGVFHKQRTGAGDKPVYEITLNPEDGLYPLPYMARQANGQPWEMDGTE